VLAVVNRSSDEPVVYRVSESGTVEATSGMLHLAARTQCWASHCLHFGAAEEKHAVQRQEVGSSAST
jgi:hypothetical protein